MNCLKKKLHLTSSTLSMATSDVLQFHYYVENECARNATKGFAGILGEAFEQYKKLWNEYLKLQKRCEDNDVKIPFAVCESESCRNEVAGIPETSQHCAGRREGPASLASSENTKASTSLYERVSNVCSSDFTSDCEDSFISDNKPVQNQMVNDELLTSPILVRKRSKSRRSSSSLQGRSILEDSEDSSMCLSMKENNSILISSTQEDVSKEIECSFTENNNDQIECTPISKMTRKLGVSNLYNVHTTLLQNGKKLKQSKLVFLPTEETTANAAYKVCKDNALKPHMSPMPVRNVKGNSKNGIKPMDEEIIQSSPTKGVDRNLKIKNLRLKRKSPAKHIQKHSIFDKIIDNKTSRSKLPLTEIHQASVSQCLPVDTCTQNDELQLIKRSKTFAPLHPESIVNTMDITNSPFSRLLVTSQDVYFEDSDFDTELSIPENETKSVENAENDNEAQKMKFSESTSQSQKHSSTCDDETFFILEENRRQNPTLNVDASKEKIPHSKIFQFPRLKKRLMDSFDILPEKKDVPIYRTSKNRSERAKMTGVSCWECKQYYASLGLSEDEIKARQNQCSRHRTVHNEKKDTPEGFWDPLFPDTFTSTFPDD